MQGPLLSPSAAATTFKLAGSGGPYCLLLPPRSFQGVCQPSQPLLLYVAVSPGPDLQPTASSKSNPAAHKTTPCEKLIGCSVCGDEFRLPPRLPCRLLRSVVFFLGELSPTAAYCGGCRQHRAPWGTCLIHRRRNRHYPRCRLLRSSAFLWCIAPPSPSKSLTPTMMMLMQSFRWIHLQTRFQPR